MARYQYRLTGRFDWSSSVGNALVALENLASSGKRVTIRSLEIDVQRSKRAGSQDGLERVYVGVARGSGVDGAVVPVTPLDSNVALPSGIVVRSQGTFTVVDKLTRSSAVGGGFDPNATFGLLCKPGALGGEFKRNGTIGLKRGTPLTGAIVARPGEAIGIVVSGDPNSGAPPVIVSASFRAGGGMFSATTFAHPGADGEALLWLQNDSAGNVEWIDWSVSLLGAHTVSPYFQVVPYAGVPLESVDTARSFNLLSKMDSAYPDPGSWVRVVRDTPLTPSGAPIQYASDVGAGVPKGFNYLGTKDFLGPVYRTYFPEFTGTSSVAGERGDAFGLSWRQKNHDLLLRRGPGIVLRPGEGIAIAPAAETIGSSAAATSGMFPVLVNIAVDVENLVQPFLVLNGVQAGSDIVVLEPGTDTVLASVDSLGGTTYSLAYDPDEFQDVDVCVYKAGYVPFTVRNLNLGAFGATVPVAQIVDRNFSNP